MAHSTLHLTQMLTSHQRPHTVDLPQVRTEEELAGDWTLSAADREQVRGSREDDNRLRFGIQLRGVRCYERFLDDYASVHRPHPQLSQRPTQFPSPFPAVEPSHREATQQEHERRIREYCGLQTL